MTSRSWTVIQPVGVCQVVSSTIVPVRTGGAAERGCCRTEPEEAGGPVKECPEDARGVGARQAQPLDRPVGRDQAALLAVRQESVVGDWRNRLSGNWLSVVSVAVSGM